MSSAAAGRMVVARKPAAAIVLKCFTVLSPVITSKRGPLDQRPHLLSACRSTLCASGSRVILGVNLGDDVLNLFLGLGHHLARSMAHFVDAKNSRSEKWI